ncbi:NAD(P)/FAD-dependent oxidoreductase [Roseomonas sp. USHLN139]|uniref:NAD(P)/FAD-dependent oxidoreductase n=1 Tax=Roseomonas sp. USHLN139 TaxID=3081298 RepID=UPI003B01A4D0
MAPPLPIGVVGAGIIGVACARALQRAGHRVLLVDPAPPGSLCSAGNAGHIAIDHIRPLARPEVLRAVPAMLLRPLGPLTLRWSGLPAMLPWLRHFAAASRPGRVEAGTTALAGLLATARADWETELGLSGLASILRQQGALNVFETEAGQAAALAETPVLARFGIRTRDLSPDEVLALLPGLRKKPAGGRIFTDAAHVLNPYRLARALAEKFVVEGGGLLARPVTGFRREGGRIAALTLPQGEQPVSGLVLASGIASAGLARQLGVHLPLTAERGYHVMLAPGGPDFALPTTFNERGFVATPMEMGTRLAGTVEFGAGGRPPNWRRAEVLARHVQDLYGAAPGIAERWSGDRPTLPDYLPALGRLPGLENAVVATGHQHLGLTLAATSARLVAALFGGGPAPALAAFDPGRF